MCRETPPLPARVPAADDRTGSRRPIAGGPGRRSLSHRRKRSATGSRKPIATRAAARRPDQAEREELARLRRENKQLRLEREILSKAAAWFARETKAIPSKGSSS